MSLASAVRPTIRFGLFELDLTAGELRKQGRKLRLQGQPFQVLALLVSRAGEVVTREELRQLLWPAGTFVEFDQGLNTAIKKIRLALGDSADNPRFIETIPRKGYRLIAPVEKPTAAPAMAVPIGKRRLIWAAAALFVIGAGTIAVLQTKVSSPGPPLPPVPLTTYPGFQIGPTFSSDGNDVAFAWAPLRPNSQSESNIYIKAIGGGEPVKLTHGPGDEWSPAWSPDGRLIAFLRCLSPNLLGIFVVPAIGGTERKLGEMEVDACGRSVDYRGGCLAWSPNSKWLFYSARDSSQAPFSIFRLSIETGERERVTSPPQGSFGDFIPAVSPDAKALVFTRFFSASTSDLFLAGLTNTLALAGEPRRLTFDVNAFAGAWMPNGREIIFSHGEFHTHVLSRLDISNTSRPERLEFSGENVGVPAISRQGRLVYEQGFTDVDIYRLELNGHELARKAPERLISTTRLEHGPSYSPDGKRIAFSSDRSGSMELWVANADGWNPVQLTSFGPPQYTDGPSWSPDGSLILFRSTAHGQQGIYVIGAEGGRPKRLDIPHLADNPDPTWSHDGKWIYFTARRDGRDERCKMAWLAPEHYVEPERAGTKAFGRGGSESPDGKFIYQLEGSDPEFSLWRTPVNGGAGEQVLPSVLNNNFAVVSGGIYFIPASQPFSIRFLSFATGKQVLIAKLPPSTRNAARAGEPAWGFSVSPDERYLLFTEYEACQASLMLVENFR